LPTTLRKETSNIHWKGCLQKSSCPERRRKIDREREEESEKERVFDKWREERNVDMILLGDELLSHKFKIKKRCNS
jgi:hypothetical protein